MKQAMKAHMSDAARSAAHIVLVEDNAGDAYLLEKALQARHILYTLTRYEDGEEGIRELSSDLAPIPDLILLDLNVPLREGFDVLRAVRTRPALVGVPVGILTSSNSARDRHRSSLMGAERYIHKPLTLEEFIDEVGQAVEDMLPH